MPEDFIAGLAKNNSTKEVNMLPDKVLDSLTGAQALCIMNRLIEIHNQLTSDKPFMGWFCMGVMVESMAAKVRAMQDAQNPASPNYVAPAKEDK